MFVLYSLLSTSELLIFASFEVSAKYQAVSRWEKDEGRKVE